MNNNITQPLTLIDRDEAEARGLTRYYTGQLCKRSHLSERYTSTGGCVSCLLRRVPKKTAGVVGQYLPARGLYFANVLSGEPPSVVEAQAAYRYIEAAGWHLAALEKLRADPAMMAEFDHEWTLAEQLEKGRNGPVAK